ncbi:hypothetical protein BGX28_006562 [Mortierella sp. GBA30]|nr:hypothetical protein BGX28_006562 [Mortierella sp. GBA30]
MSPPQLPPELLLLVAGYMSPKDVVNCLQVHKSWYYTFLFLIWRKVELVSSKTERDPSMEALHHHQHLIKSLTLLNTSSDAYCSSTDPLCFENLETLTVEAPSSPDPFAPAHEFQAQLSLRFLELSDVNPLKIGWFLSSISQFHSLSTLEISRTTIDQDDTLSLWRVFPQLESLLLRKVSFPDMKSIRENMASMACPRLTSLALHLKDTKLAPEDQIQLILSCPALKALRWYNISDQLNTFTAAYRQLIQALEEGKMPDLEEFRTRGDDLDFELAQVLRHMKRVRAFQAQSNGFGSESFQVLMTHFATVRVLDIQDCDAMTSDMILTILFSCRVLETLMVDCVSAKNAVEDDRDWVCSSSLKTLSLSFRFQRDEAHLQSRVFEKLGRLTKIENFLMAKRHHSCHEETGLRLCLEDGLGKLSSWKYLKYINFILDSSLVVENADLSWMVSHWRRLELFIGRVVDPDVDETFKEDIRRRNMRIMTDYPEDTLIERRRLRSQLPQ